MAENSPTNKTGILAKAQKRIARTKTKVLQNLGKAEKTTDDIVSDYVTKVDKQQETGHHLHKELKNYVHCIRNLCQASKTLHACLAQTYEEEWTDEPEVKEHMTAFDLLWSDYAQNLQESISSLQTYLHSFPSIKNKVAKRGRKMVDFDNMRHHMEVLQGAKKRDEVKIQKAQDDLNEAKRIYEQMNTELHTELPEFHNSRVSFYAGLFTGMFGSEFVFHSEMGKINGNLGDISQKLAKEYEHFVYKPKTPFDKTVSINSASENVVNGDNSSAPSTPIVSSPHGSTLPSPTREDSSEPMYHNQAILDASQAKVQSSTANGGDKVEDKEDNIPHHTPRDSPVVLRQSEGKQKETSSATAEDKQDRAEDVVENENLYTEPRESPPATFNHTSGNAANEDEADNLYSGVPSNRPLYNAPPDALYTVEATHKYAGEDEDELSFESGEIIHVIEFENPEEQDDGWQMGIKQSDGKKGVFPENFTRRMLE